MRYISRCYIKYIYLILILLLYFAFSYFWISNTPLSSDGSYHTQFFIQNYYSETLTYLHNHLFGHYGFPRLQQFSLNYPPLYHLLGGIYYEYFGNKTAYVLDAIFGLCISFISILLFKKNNDRLLVLFFCLFANIFFIAGGNNNIILLLGMFGCITSLYLYQTYRYNGYYILFIIFSIFGFGTKQPFYFLFPFISLTFIILSYKNQNYKKLYIYIISVIIGIIPILFWQIKNTGTLSTQTIQGRPIIDKYIFNPRHFKIDNRQKEIDVLVDIKHLDEISARHYYTINTGPLDILDRKFWDKLLLNSYSILPGSLYFSIQVNIALLIMCILGGIFLYKKEKNIFNLFIFGIISGYIVYLFTSRIEYSLIIPLLLFLFILNGLILIKKINKISCYFIYTILLLSFLVYSIQNIYIQKDFLEKTYMRAKMNNKDSFVELTKYIYGSINNNDKKNALFLHSNSQDFPFITQLNTFRDFRLFFLTENELKYYLPKYIEQGFKYIIINKATFSNEFRNRNTFYVKSDLYNMINNGSGFSMLYENQDFIFYKVENNYFSQQLK